MLIYCILFRVFWTQRKRFSHVVIRLFWITFWRLHVLIISLFLVSNAWLKILGIHQEPLLRNWDERAVSLIELTVYSTLKRLKFELVLRIFLRAVETGVAQLDLANTVNIEEWFVTARLGRQQVRLLAQLVDGLLSLHQVFSWGLVDEMGWSRMGLTQRVRFLPLDRWRRLSKITVGNAWLFQHNWRLAVRVVIFRRS